MNIFGKTLAALMVATMSLTVAPLAAADNEVPCQGNADGAMTANGADFYKEESIAIPPGDASDVWTLDNLATGTYTVTISGRNGDLAPVLTIYEVDSAARCVNPTPVPGSASLVGDGSKDFRFHVTLPLDASSTHDYRIDVVKQP